MAQALCPKNENGKHRAMVNVHGDFRSKHCMDCGIDLEKIDPLETLRKCVLLSTLIDEASVLADEIPAEVFGNNLALHLPLKYLRMIQDNLPELRHPAKALVVEAMQHLLEQAAPQPAQPEARKHHAQSPSLLCEEQQFPEFDELKG